MRTSYIFKQLTWLVEVIRHNRRITLKALSEKWSRTEMSGGLPLARASFYRYKDAILDMFGIIIDCQRRGGNKYYIANEEELTKDTVQNWMYSSLSINMALEDKRLLFDRIILEYVPSAGEHLKTILQAMVDNHQMRMSYRKYEAFEAKEYTACPYCLKLFRCRWYALMKVVRDGETEPHLAVFSIDRICYLSIMDDTFTIPKDFSAQEYFSESFGVVAGDGTQSTTIRLRAFGRERYALQDLPIHHSQQLVNSGSDYTDFEVCLRPTADFKAYLASRGQWLIVMSPKWLAEEVVQIHREGIEKYQGVT